MIRFLLRVRLWCVLSLFLLVGVTTPSNAFLQFAAPYALEAAVPLASAAIARAATGAVLADLATSPLISLLGLTGIASLMLGDRYTFPVAPSSGSTQVAASQASMPGYTNGYQGTVYGSKTAACNGAAIWRNSNGTACAAYGPEMDSGAMTSSTVCTITITCQPPGTGGSATTNITASTTTETRTGTHTTHVDAVATPTGWYPDATDTNWTSGDKTPFTAGCTSLTTPCGVVVPTSTIANGGVGTYPQVTYIYPDGSGNTGIQISTQGVDGSGNVQTTTRTVTVSPAGTITGATQQTSPGATVNPTSGQVQTQASPPSAGSSGSSSVAVTNWPSDFPDAGTHALLTSTNSLITSTNTKLDTLHTDLTSTSASAPSDPGVRPSSDITALMPDSTFSGLQGWTLPARSVSCPTASFTVWSYAFTIDAHCTLWSGIASNVQAVMLAVWVVVALFVVLAA